MKNFIRKWLGIEELEIYTHAYVDQRKRIRAENLDYACEHPEKQPITREEFTTKIDAIFNKKYNRPYFASVFKKALMETELKSSEKELSAIIKPVPTNTTGLIL